MGHREGLWAVGAAAGLAALLAGAPAAFAAGRSAAEEAIAGWPAGSRTAARAMIESHGPPQKIQDGELVWFGPGDWKRTAVRENPGPDGAGVVEQTVAFHADQDAARRVREFDQRASVDVQAAELTVRTDGEASNFLLANLANEVASGFRSPDEARDFYARQVGLENAGKTTPYLEGLNFIARPMPVPTELPNGKVGPASP